MKTRGTIIILCALSANLVLSLYLLSSRESDADEQLVQSADSRKASEAGPHHAANSKALASLRSDVVHLQKLLGDTLATTDEEDGTSDLTSLSDRLTSIERSIAHLKNSMDGINMEAASTERQKVFAGENGHLRADEYAEAGKHAIAGEGYLTFLEAHPDHPDHRSILERARNSFNKAGYGEKAIWAQKELMRIYPETRQQDLMTLAGMEKRAGRFGTAAQHAEEAASLNTNSQRYWNLLYAAWYTELDQGPQAGLAYYRNVQQQMIEAGENDGNLARSAQEKIERLERIVASQ